MPTLRLNTLLSSMASPDFIKIDVEGAELLVLQGARKIIEEVRPVFYIEVGESVSVEVFELFSRHGYCVMNADGDVLEGKCGENFLFVPLEKNQALSCFHSSRKGVSSPIAPLTSSTLNCCTTAERIRFPSNWNGAGFFR